MTLKSATIGQKASQGSEEGVARRCERYEEGPSFAFNANQLNMFFKRKSDNCVCAQTCKYKACNTRYGGSRTGKERAPEKSWQLGCSSSGRESLAHCC